jgi:hypothetical protein
VLPANTGTFYPGKSEDEDDARLRREKRIWWTWVLGTSLTWAALTGIVAVVGRFVPAVRGQDEGWEYVLYLAAGIVQARALRRYARGARWWAAVTAAAAAVAVALHVALFAGPVPLWRDASRPLRDAATTLIDFGLIALAQWLWLRPRVRRARWWLVATLIPAAILALLSLGATAGDANEARTDEDPWLLVFSVVIVALLVTIPAASTIIRLLRRPVEPLPSPVLPPTAPSPSGAAAAG